MCNFGQWPSWFSSRTSKSMDLFLAILFLENFEFAIAAYGEIKKLGLAGSNSTYRGYFGLVAFNVILRLFGALLIFHNLVLLISDRRKHFGWL